MKMGIVAVMLAASSAVIAEEASEHICRTIEKSATVVMSARLNGVPMGEVMDVYEKGGLGDFKEIVRQAYSSPGYATERMKARAIVEFGNEWASACYREFASRDD